MSLFSTQKKSERGRGGQEDTRRGRGERILMNFVGIVVERVLDIPHNFRIV